MRLQRSFFERDVTTVAKELLGCTIVHKSIEAEIVETEAYGDHNDLASHAHFGNRGRSKIMFGPAGILYVYSIYGLFNLTNIICGKDGNPSAVLLRAAQIISGHDIVASNLKKSKFVKIDKKLATGPGKLSLALGVDRSYNNLDVIASDEIYLERPTKRADFDIIETNRIGIDYAGHSRDLPWRFYIKSNNHIIKI